MRQENNFSLLKYNTFGLNVFCRKFIEYDTVEELKTIVNRGAFNDFDKWFHIGGGSNLLFLQDYEGLILHSLIKGIEIIDDIDNECFIRVGAGEIWDDFVAWSVKNQLGGIENLSLIPGEVGASPVQNIGAYGVEAKDVIESVETIFIENASLRNFQNQECQFAYRNSIFKRQSEYIVTHVIFRLKKLPYYKYKLEYGKIREKLECFPEVKLQDIRNVIISIRKEKLPDVGILGSAGSFFKNPVVSEEKFVQLQKEYPLIPFYPALEKQVKIPAGWIIEQCGWKGKLYKRAGVYDKQALILVNKGGASGNEIWELAMQIKDSVLNKFGIKIEPEVCLIE